MLHKEGGVDDEEEEEVVDVAGDPAATPVSSAWTTLSLGLVIKKIVMTQTAIALTTILVMIDSYACE